MTYYGNSNAQDATIAGDVLINIKAPQVNEKLKTYMESLEKQAATNPWLLAGNTEPMKNVFRLVEAYQSKEAMGVLYRIAVGPVRQRSGGNINGDKYTWSTRTAALATVVTTTGQKLEDYKVRKNPMLNMWVCSTEEEEDDAVKKLQEWAAANGAKWGLKAEAEPAALMPVCMI